MAKAWTVSGVAASSSPSMRLRYRRWSSADGDGVVAVAVPFEVGRLGVEELGQHGLEGRPGRLDADADGHEQGQEPVVGLDPQRDTGVGREVEGEDVLAGGRGQVEEEAGVDADPGVAAGGAGHGGRGVGVAVPGGDGPEPAGRGVDVEDEALLLVGVEPRRPQVGAVDDGEEVLGRHA